MDEVESTDELMHNFLDFSQGELHGRVVQQTSEIMFTELKDKVECTPVTVVLCG